MKIKILALILALILLFSLAACGVAPAPATDTPATDTPATGAPSGAPTEAQGGGTPAPKDTPEPTIPPEPRVIVISDLYAEEFNDEAGELLLSAAYALPVVEIEGYDAAADRINSRLAEMKNRFMTSEDEYDGGIPSMLESARYAREQGYGGAYGMEHKYTVARGDGLVLSFRDASYTNQGGPHGYTAFTGLNFNILPGGELSLNDLSADPADFKDILTARVLELAKEHEYADGFIDGYEERIPNNIADGFWYLSAEGLVVIYNAYDIGPYAMGAVEFTVPYSELEGHMDEKWLPAGDVSDGELGASLAGEDPAEAPIADIVIDEGGEELTIRAAGTVRNVILSGVSSYNGIEYYETSMPAFVSRMDEGESISVTTYIPDVMSNLRLSYDSGGETVTRYIAQSGEDGSILLLEG